MFCILVLSESMSLARELHGLAQSSVCLCRGDIWHCANDENSFNLPKHLWRLVRMVKAKPVLLLKLVPKKPNRHDKTCMCVIQNKQTQTFIYRVSSTISESHGWSKLASRYISSTSKSILIQQRMKQSMGGVFHTAYVIVSYRLANKLLLILYNHKQEGSKEKVSNISKVTNLGWRGLMGSPPVRLRIKECSMMTQNYLVRVTELTQCCRI